MTYNRLPFLLCWLCTLCPWLSLSVMTSVYCLFMQTPGFPGKKGEQVSCQIPLQFYLTEVTLFSHIILHSDGFPLLYCYPIGRERPAWSWRVEGREGRGGTERRESKQPVDDDVQGSVQPLVCEVHLQPGIYLIHFLHLPFRKGSPGSGGSLIAGPKGESGDRVSPEWSHYYVQQQKAKPKRLRLLWYIFLTMRPVIPGINMCPVWYHHKWTALRRSVWLNIARSFHICLLLFVNRAQLIWVFGGRCRYQY